MPLALKVNSLIEGFLNKPKNGVQLNQSVVPLFVFSFRINWRKCLINLMGTNSSRE